MRIARLLILILLFSLMGCNQGITNSSEEAEEALTLSEVDMQPAAEGDPKLDVQEMLLWTPEPNHALITGRLVKTDNTPYVGGLYLADVIQANEPDAPPLFAFDQITSPHAVQDENGYFAFYQVQPGNYALTLANPAGQTILRGTNTGIALIVTANPGEKLDLGEITIP
jgi:hypothetical protein